jgi:hypothetical protein
MKNEGGGMRSLRGSETAEANRPGYEGATHEQGSILAEGVGFVFYRMRSGGIGLASLLASPDLNGRRNR